MSERQPCRKRAQRARGLTIIELLIAIVILAVALLALAAGLLDGLRGISRDGRVTTANQVAVSVLEELREQIRADGETSERTFDTAVSGAWSEPVRGTEYEGDYTVTPWQVDGDGNLLDVPTGDVPHLYEVTFTIELPESSPRTYSTLVARTP